MLMFYLQMIESDEDKSKFEIVYLEYRGLLHKIAYNILHHEEDSEDAVHQAFLYIVENIWKINEPISPQTKSYLVNTVECRAKNIKDAKYKKMEIPLDDAEGISAEYKGENRLTKCVSQLSGRYREVLTFKYKFGLDNKAIARMMNTTEVNVRKMEERAKKKLYELCRKEGLM